jgi:hypothetical protein
MAHGFLPRISLLYGLINTVRKGRNHAARKYRDINSQIYGPRFLPRILSGTGLVEKIVKTGNHATRNSCDFNSQIKGPGEEARSVSPNLADYIPAGGGFPADVDSHR